jgi:hypothetical protein
VSPQRDPLCGAIFVFRITANILISKHNIAEWLTNYAVYASLPNEF